MRLLPLLLVFLFAACATKGPVREEPFPVPPPPPKASPIPDQGGRESGRFEAEADLEAVLAAARGLLGQKEVEVAGTRFRADCSGFVRGVYSVSGIDLMGLSDLPPGMNGVAIIRLYNERHGENHRRLVPRRGDLVYFDNTYDLNGNGRPDDPLTHVGIVDEVDEDGTVHFIHRSTSRGVVREPMNLSRPGERADERGKFLNAWVRARSSRDPAGMKYFAGELFAGFGTVFAGRTTLSMHGSEGRCLCGL